MPGNISTSNPVQGYVTNIQEILDNVQTLQQDFSKNNSSWSSINESDRTQLQAVHSFVNEITQLAQRYQNQFPPQLQNYVKNMTPYNSGTGTPGGSGSGSGGTSGGSGGSSRSH